MRPIVYRRCSSPLLLPSTRAAAAEVLVVLTICRVDTATAAVGVVLITDIVTAAVLVGEA